MSHASVEQQVGDRLGPQVRSLVAGPSHHGGRRELHPHDGRDLEQLTIRGGELVELLFDELTDAVGDPEAVERFLAAHLAGGVSQKSAIDHVVDHCRHEQGVAVGVLVDVGDQRVRWSTGCEPLMEVGGDRRSAQQLQGEETALPLGPEVPHDLAQGVRLGQHLRGPVRAHDQQAGRCRPPGQVGQQLDGRAIAPVQALAHEHERPIGGEHLQGVAQLPEHPLRRRPDRPQPQRLEVGGLEQPGQLQQPRRRGGTEDLTDVVTVGAATQAGEGVQDGQVRLTLAELSDTQPPPDQHVLPLAEPVDEHVDQRRLADTYRGGDEHHLPASAIGPAATSRRARRARPPAPRTELPVGPSQEATWARPAP